MSRVMVNVNQVYVFASGRKIVKARFKKNRKLKSIKTLENPL